jgi:hypothetical protein
VIKDLTNSEFFSGADIYSFLEWASLKRFPKTKDARNRLIEKWIKYGRKCKVARIRKTSCW